MLKAIKVINLYRSLSLQF